MSEEERGERENLNCLSGGLPPGSLTWGRRQPFCWPGADCVRLSLCSHLFTHFSFLTPLDSYLVVVYSVGMWISNDLLNDSSGRPGLSA